jgi:hypothetical protein
MEDEQRNTKKNALRTIKKILDSHASKINKDITGIRETEK